MSQTVKRRLQRMLTTWLSQRQVEFLENALYRSIHKQKFAALFRSQRIEVKERVWDKAIDIVGRSSKVMFLEFGTFEGYSIRYFASGFVNPASRFYGFDSFEGLPEDWGSKVKGTFSTAGNLPDVADDRVSFEKGWFQDTLPPFSIQGQDFDAVFVHMDADLYSSTMFVLSNLWSKLPTFFALFDEFSGHETRALYNFHQSFPCDIEFLAHDFASPNRVLCRITRTSAPGPGKISFG